MKRLFSTNYSPASFNLALFLLRLGLGVLMIPHGYDKLVHFKPYSKDFINFLSMGGTVSLALVVFAEFFCSIFLIAGLFTRAIVIPLIIDTSVALMEAHHGDVFGKGEHPTLFIIGFLAIFLVGPGKISVDGAISK